MPRRRSSRSRTSGWWGTCSRCCQRLKWRFESSGSGSSASTAFANGYLSMRILLLGTYDTGKPRIRILRDGLRGPPAVELQENHSSELDGIVDNSTIQGLVHRIVIITRWVWA